MGSGTGIRALGHLLEDFGSLVSRRNVVVLGLPLIREEPEALAFDANGTMLRLTVVDKLCPAGYTALGWDVTDIREEIAQLESRGVTFGSIARMPQEKSGIWTAPDGSRVAWFVDPD